MIQNNTYSSYMDVLVLSTGYEPLYRISWMKALTHTFTGRLEIVESSDSKKIGTVSGQIPMPTVVRFKTGVFAGKWLAQLNTVKLSRKNLWIRDNGQCQYCSKEMKVSNYEIEHVLPKSRGGKSTWNNLVVACGKCNQKKGARTPEEAGMKLLKTPHKPTMTELQIRHPVAALCTKK